MEKATIITFTTLKNACNVKFGNDPNSIKQLEWESGAENYITIDCGFIL